MEIFAQRYKMVRRLGKGGMGSVWLAERVGLGRPVAIKLLDSTLDDTAALRERFEGEARALAMLKSRHIVGILDFGVWNGTPFHVMDVLDGEDLESRLRRVGRLTPTALAPLVDHVCRGLLRAHAEGLVHRDLKPANIFLALEEGEEIAKIIDFGIVKVMGTTGKNVTQTGDVVGTPLYMSPEQVRGNRDVDHRSDLWSLGVTVFRALTGRFPFDGATSGDILVRICTEEPPRVRELNPTLPPEVDAFFERALARAVHERFQSAEDFANAFQLVARATTGSGRAVASVPGGSLRPVAVSSVDSGAARSGPGSALRTPAGTVSVPRGLPLVTEQTTSSPRDKLVPLLVAVVVLLAGGLVFFGWLALRRTDEAAMPKGMGTMEFRASSMDCVDPSAPDPDRCELECGTGRVSVDRDFEQSNTPRAAFLTFQIDASLSGRVIDRVTLVLYVPDAEDAASDSPGELWDVEPFTRQSLFVAAPSKTGGAPLFSANEAVRRGGSVRMTIPVDRVRPNQPLYLGLFPVSSNGVDYYSDEGSKPPTLLVEFH